MQRCLELAKLGRGHTYKNPLVGAVLVYNDLIIGEGYHQAYGEAHAEVNCIQSVAKEHRHLISEATLYVNLEPCNHTGKTPPCTLAIMQAGIKKVFIGSEDYNPIVSGQGVAALQQNNIEVQCGILTDSCYKLNKVFFTNQQAQRAFVKLKWAETANGYIGETEKNLSISHNYTNILSHKHRTQVEGILVGYNTAFRDTPNLNARTWLGKQPARVFLDWQCTLEESILKKEGQRNIVLNLHQKVIRNGIEYVQVEKNAQQISKKLLDIGICSIIVEGGAKTHSLFIQENCWDEAIIIRSNKTVSSGISAARLPHCHHLNTLQLRSDCILHFSNSAFLR